jgi:hypothetical protein
LNQFAMRIIGEIAHPKLKISVFASSGKTTIQFEDGLLTQSYKFRDGSVVTSFEEAVDFVDQDFIDIVEKRFNEMNMDLTQRSENIIQSKFDFPNII